MAKTVKKAAKKAASKSAAKKAAKRSPAPTGKTSKKAAKKTVKRKAKARETPLTKLERALYERMVEIDELAADMGLLGAVEPAPKKTRKKR